MPAFKTYHEFYLCQVTDRSAFDVSKFSLNTGDGLIFNFQAFATCPGQSGFTRRQMEMQKNIMTESPITNSVYEHDSTAEAVLVRVQQNR